MTSKIFSVATFIVVSWLAVTVISTSNRVNTLETTLLNGMAASSAAMNQRITKMESAQRNNHQSLIGELEAITILKSTPQAKSTLQAKSTPQAKPTPPEKPPAPAETDNSTLIAETAKLRQDLAAHTKFTELKKAYNDVIESELEKYSSATEAAEKLLSTKGAIWKASTEYPNVKQGLQGLMAPIDVLAARWKSGDTNGTVGPVFRVLQQTLAILGADI